MEVGDVVIVEEEVVLRHMWILMVVLNVLESFDGFSRGAEILVRKTVSRIKKKQCQSFILLSITDIKKNTKPQEKEPGINVQDTRLQSQLMSSSDTNIELQFLPGEY